MFHQELSLEVDIAHTLELIIVHDLVEIYAGDTPAYDVAARRTKRTRETAAANRLFVLLPHDLGSDNHWNEESGSLLDAVPRIRA
jgi:5'-deoxynucleotidase YfbR-like HD superfamily hydrolase